MMREGCSLMRDISNQLSKGYCEIFSIPRNMVPLPFRIFRSSFRLQHQGRSLFSSTAVKSTIYALATAPGKAGVGIIRISGHNAISVLNRLLMKSDINIKPNVMKRASFYDSKGDLLDQGMYVVFLKPASFTGEDVVELHLHSSSAVIASCYESLERLDGLRLARPGEFIERAWKNGKMDLLQVESIADLLEAETAQQQKIALGQARHATLREWKNELIEGCAILEAMIDFEEDDAAILYERARLETRLSALCQAIKGEVDQKFGEIVRQGLKVVICGPPNAGKSSLFNMLLKRNAAIVSPIPGTTRDVLCGTIQLNGLPVVLYDTAGLREDTEDVVEREGIKKAKELIEEADLIILLSSPDTACEDLRIPCGKSIVRVLNKTDLASSNQIENKDITLNCITGEGLEALIDVITQHYPKMVESPVITRSRHRIHLQDCLVHLESACKERELEIMAEFMRLALKDMGRITGEVDSEQILDKLFSSFCIGK